MGNMIKWKAWLALASICTLSACGGGSSGGSNDDPVAPAPSTTPTITVSATPTSMPTQAPTATTTPSPSTEPTTTPTVTPTATPTTNPTPTPTPTPTPADPSAQTLSGRVTYDYVPHQSFGALDYDAIEARPARSVKVELLSSSDEVLQTTATNNNGDYVFVVDENLDVKVRVWAQLILSNNVANTSENVITVTDNTSQNAAYVMDGNVLSTGSESSSRDFHADSGWGGSSYTSTRVAAPFAIADSVYEAAMLIRNSDASAAFQNVELRWSVNNTPVNGTLTSGQIGTSFYNGDAMYILGDQDNDTDEYDRSVVQHEFGHYIEDTMSRSDSIGGSHSLQTLIDMRVSFSEGFANAFTAIASNTGYYEDSYDTGQTNGFRFSLETASTGTVGFYAEKSAGGLIYDIADSNNDSGDTISLGFSPIYDAMTSDEYINSNALTSIYLFAEVVKSLVSEQEAASIDDILQTTQVFGSGIFGEGETNDGGVNYVLPVYETLSNGNTVNVCVNDSTGNYNGIDVRRFVLLTINNSDNYLVTAIKTSGAGDRDPDIVIYRDGEFVTVLERATVDSEVDTVDLEAGDYILEFYDYNNVGDVGATGAACFDISVT